MIWVHHYLLVFFNRAVKWFTYYVLSSCTNFQQDFQTNLFVRVNGAQEMIKTLWTCIFFQYTYHRRTGRDKYNAKCSNILLSWLHVQYTFSVKDLCMRIHFLKLTGFTWKKVLFMVVTSLLHWFCIIINLVEIFQI